MDGMIDLTEESPDKMSPQRMIAVPRSKRSSKSPKSSPTRRASTSSSSKRNEAEILPPTPPTFHAGYEDERMCSGGTSSSMDYDDDILERPAYLSSFTRQEPQPPKLTKEQLRAAKKVRKEEEKKAEKAEKQQTKLQAQQDQGKFCQSEIAVIIEPDLISTSLGAKLCSGIEAKMFHDSPKKLGVPHTVRWCRRDYLLGGATDQLVEGNIELDVFAVVFPDPAEFLGLLGRDSQQQDDHPDLRKWVKNLRTKVSNRRIVLVLVDVVGELNKLWKGTRRRKSWTPTTEVELKEAIVWMLLEEKIECTLCNNDEQVVEFLADMTIQLAKGPYIAKISELDCQKKFKAGKNYQNEEQMARDTWFRMLQAVPGISEEKASVLTSYYPTISSVLDKYGSCKTELEKANLLNKCFSRKSSNPTLSHRVYKLLTSDDAGEVIVS